MPKRKVKTLNNPKDKAVQDLLDSVLECEGPSTSQTPKRQILGTSDEGNSYGKDMCQFNMDDKTPSTTIEEPSKTQTISIYKRRDAIDERKEDRSDFETTTKSVEVQTDPVLQYDILSLRSEFLKEIKGLRRSFIYSINKMQKDISEEIGLQKNKLNTLSVATLKKNIGLEAPLHDLDTFHEFDNKIKNEEFAVSLRQFMSFKTRTKGLYEAIGAFLSVVMTYELQLMFSGCGKPNKGVAKENFSATQIYNELKDNLLKQFPSETESSILAKTSRWLAAAKGRQSTKDLPCPTI